MTMMLDFEFPLLFWGPLVGVLVLGSIALKGFSARKRTISLITLALVTLALVGIDSELKRKAINGSIERGELIELTGQVQRFEKHNGPYSFYVANERFYVATEEAYCLSGKEFIKDGYIVKMKYVFIKPWTGGTPPPCILSLDVISKPHIIG
jgi:hypothetical protein